MRTFNLSMLAFALALGGCATLSPDGGIGPVAKTASERIGKDLKVVASDADERALQDTVRGLLKTPLSADAAVQVALLNNRGLQADFARLGIADAQRVQAGRLANPGVDFKHSSGGSTTVIERTLTFDLVAALTLPISARIEADRFAQTQWLVADQVLRLAAATREAYFEGVAAVQGVAYAKQVSVSAQAGAELAARMATAGNFSQLESAREQAFHAEAEAGLLRATQAAASARERLARLLGLADGDASYALPERLPDLPEAPPELREVEQIAVTERLDIRAARLATEETARSLGLAKATRWINVFDLGYVRNSESGRPSAPGYELNVEIPLFDWGDARSAKAEAIYMESANRLAETVVDARSQARESYLAYRAAYDLARRYRDEIVPLRRRISGDTLLRYNGMLISVFELLADARDQAAAVNAAINAQKDFWVAQTALQTALGGSLAASMPIAAIHGDKP